MVAGAGGGDKGKSVLSGYRVPVLVAVLLNTVATLSATELDSRINGSDGWVLYCGCFPTIQIKKPSPLTCRGGAAGRGIPWRKSCVGPGSLFSPRRVPQGIRALPVWPSEPLEGRIPVMSAVQHRFLPPASSLTCKGSDKALAWIYFTDGLKVKN